METVCLALLLLLVPVGVHAYAEGTTLERWPPRLLLNSDCGTPVFYRSDAPMTKDQLCHVVNDLPGTQVDAFLPCPQFSDDQFWFPMPRAVPFPRRKETGPPGGRRPREAGWQGQALLGHC